MISRPRLVRWWEAPADVAGAGTPAGSFSWRMVLWERLPAEFSGCITTAAMVREGCLRCVTLGDSGSSLVLVGNRPDLIRLADEIESRVSAPGGRLLREVVDAPGVVRELRLKSGVLRFERPAVVGILNVTPDSFFDGGRDSGPDEVIERGLRMAQDGATILEVGGEKAGPGEPVSEKEELRRVIPVIEGLCARSRLPVSIDTRKPSVARRAVQAGATIINDINGMRDHSMRRAAAETGAGVVLMHIQGEPRVHQPRPVYGSVIGDVTQFLHRQIDALARDGVAPDRIVIDPGPAFGKTPDQDFSLLSNWSELRGFPLPLMLAISRKRFVGERLGLEPADRLLPTVALTSIIVTQGCDLIRSHDVAETAQTITLLTPLLKS